MRNQEIKEILDILEKTYPDAECALNHRNIFELLISVVLSAQTTDKSVNQVTPELFRNFPDAPSLSEASLEAVEECIKRIGMYHQKARNIIRLSIILCEQYDGNVPDGFDELTSLPGVGRKTANVVRSVGFGYPAIAVDTHVFRVSNRIGLAAADNVLDTEKQLMAAIPEERWSKTHHSLIFHGRNICSARNPDCENCPVSRLCAYNKRADD